MRDMTIVEGTGVDTNALAAINRSLENHLLDTEADLLIVPINGPPRSGKDTAAKVIFNHEEVVKNWYRMWLRYSDPLKASVLSWFGMEMDEYGTSELDRTKDQIIEMFGKSYRQLQIDMSESFMKPQYGTDVFGKLAVYRIEEQLWRRKQVEDLHHSVMPPLLVVIPDAGFYEETKALVDRFGPENFVALRMHRDGTNFDGDSRSYVRFEDMGIETWDVQNNSSIPALRDDLEDILTGTVFDR